MVSACLGPRIWLRQKQRSCEMWIASLGMGILIMWGLARTAAGNVGVRRRIWRLHLRMRLSSISKLFGRGWDELAGVGESGDKGVLQDIEFAAGGGGAVADCIEVAV